MRNFYVLRSSSLILSPAVSKIVNPSKAVFICNIVFFLFGCGNPALSKSIGIIFQQHLLILCLFHSSVILKIFQTFSFLFYLLWWSVITNLWCYYYCNCFGCQRPCSYEIVNLINVSMFWLLHWSFPHLSLSFGLLISWHKTILKLGQLKTLQRPLSKCSSERKSCMYLALNQKLEMIRLNEDVMTKARPLAPNNQQSWECKGKVLEGS